MYVNDLANFMFHTSIQYRGVLGDGAVHLWQIRYAESDPDKVEVVEPQPSTIPSQIDNCLPMSGIINPVILVQKQHDNDGTGTDLVKLYLFQN